MRGLLCALCLLVSMGNAYAFEPQSQWGRNKAQTPLNKDRLINDLDPEQWDPAWAFEPDEQAPSSRCEKLAKKACMCVMLSGAFAVCLWAVLTGRMRA